MSEHICSSTCGHHASPEAGAAIAEELNETRRQVVRDEAGGKALGASSPDKPGTAQAASKDAPAVTRVVSQHHYLPATKDTVLWGYFSRAAKPALEIDSGDYVTIEALTHHANDDAERMVLGDPGAESVFHWARDGKNIDRRGVGPMDDPLGAGGGVGVHICTGPVFIRGAQPGDVLEVRIVDIKPRPSANPLYQGKTFGSNAAANWGFHYGDMLTEPKKREVITIYEIDATGENRWAKAVYNYRWTPQADPFGVVHPVIDYPGVPVDHASVVKNYNVLRNVRVPVRAHFGTIGVAPKEADYVSSIPPNYNGGNIDNWRIGKGAVMYYPVAVDGALFSVGDPHASQGDSELCGTAIECSLTGTFQFVLHKKESLPGTALADLHYPLLETADAWLVHGFSYANYLAELPDEPQSTIFTKSSLDRAMRDAFHKMRHFLMTAKGLDEDEAISLLTVGVDFGVTQVVDGNWGVHATLQKQVFIP